MINGKNLIWKNVVSSFKLTLLQNYHKDKLIHVWPIALTINENKQIAHDLILQLEVEGFLICRTENNLEKACFYLCPQ